jgi:hypothetical protein
MGKRLTGMEVSVAIFELRQKRTGPTRMSCGRMDKSGYIKTVRTIEEAHIDAVSVSIYIYSFLEFLFDPYVEFA